MVCLHEVLILESLSMRFPPGCLHYLFLIIKSTKRPASVGYQKVGQLCYEPLFPSVCQQILVMNSLLMRISILIWWKQFSSAVCATLTWTKFNKMCFAESLKKKLHEVIAVPVRSVGDDGKYAFVLDFILFKFKWDIYERDRSNCKCHLASHNGNVKNV